MSPEIEKKYVDSLNQIIDEFGLYDQSDAIKKAFNLGIQAAIDIAKEDTTNGGHHTAN